MTALQAISNGIAKESEVTDYYMDLEFVDVRGRGRDNPHENKTWTVDDKPHKRARVLDEDYYFTSFNHYIDIKKGYLLVKRKRILHHAHSRKIR